MKADISATNIRAERLARLLRIQKIMGSNLDAETAYFA
jgi:hypothetical protein